MFSGVVGVVYCTVTLDVSATQVVGRRVNGWLLSVPLTFSVMPVTAAAKGKVERLADLEIVWLLCPGRIRSYNEPACG